MLGRSVSDAGTRLRRSKSTSTVPRQVPAFPEPLEPDIAQRQALAAATAAYARAHANAATERSKQRGSDLARTKSTSSRKSLTSQGSHFPPRESSLRSGDPPQVGKSSTAHRQSRAPTMTTEKFPSFYPTPSERPLSTQTSLTFNENIRPKSQAKVHRQDAASSVTSQQIRKARSMYYASSIQTGSPIARPPAKYLTSPPPMSVGTASDVSPALLQARTTAASPLASPQLPVSIEPGGTINKARDKYLQGFQQRQVKHKPSLFLAPFKKRQEKGKKKDRPMSAGVMPVSSASRQTPNDMRTDALDDFGMPKQNKEKRSFSGSIKDKIKRVFRRTSANNNTMMPAQHIDASRDYFNYPHVQPELHTSAERANGIPSPDDETLMRVRSRTPTIERASSPFARPTSRSSNRSRGSNRSLHSEANLTHTSSRVTSWSDSSAGGTLTQRDIKRLTVIHEAKDSIGSEVDRVSLSSLRRQFVPLPSFTAFKDPMHLESLMEEATTPVDPKRVFSALMKEIDASKTSQTPVATTVSDSSPGAESDVFESSATKELHGVAPRELHSSASKVLRPSMSSEQRPGTARSKESSIRSLGRALKSTIRTVTPSERKTPAIVERTTSIRGAVRIPRSETATTEESVSDGEEVVGNTVGSINFKMGGRTSRHSTRQSFNEQQATTPSADLIEQRVARSKERWRAPLDENKPKIPRSQDRQYSITNFATKTTTTPKTAVNIAPCAELDDDPSRSDREQIAPMQTTPISPSSSKSRQLFSPLSPSVYSRNTDGASIFPNDSVTSFSNTMDKSTSHQGGSAVIVTSRSVRRYAIGTPSPQRNTDSTHSSRDWKAWLSHEVSELGSGSQENIAIDESYTPTVGCRREITPMKEDYNTTIVRTSMDMPTPRPDPVRLVSVEHPANDDVILCLAQPHHSTIEFAPALERHKPWPKDRETSLPVKLSPIFSKKRLSSVHSGTSSGTHSSTSTPKSSHMNERFPFLNTGRRSSSYSAKVRRSSGTPTEVSSGSSHKSKTATPSPKIYSDLSAPGTSRKSRYEPNMRSRVTEGVSNEKKENESHVSHKENVTPTSSSRFQLKKPEQVRSETILSLPHNVSRPRSMLPLSSAVLNMSPSTLAQYTTTAEDTRNFPRISESTANPKTSPQRQRMRLQVSPGKLTMRPKSAFDLRGTKTHSLLFPPSPLKQNPGPQTFSPTQTIVDRQAAARAETLTQTTVPMSNITTTKQKRDSYRVSALDNETLRMLIESPWAFSGAPPSPRSSLDVPERVRITIKPKLRVKHSSSTLALNKEPLPNTAGNGNGLRGIDSVLGGVVRGVRERTESRCGVEGDLSGRITPGQRMAEKFLRERSMDSGAGGRESCMSGTSVSVKEGSLKDEGMGRGKLEREDTPAFL